jgi:hypothetical protein
VITITGAGDHDRPDWLITMTGIRTQGLVDGLNDTWQRIRRQACLAEMRGDDLRSQIQEVRGRTRLITHRSYLTTRYGKLRIPIAFRPAMMARRRG